MNKNILVLGANGFIGSALVVRLVKQANCFVEGIDVNDFNLLNVRKSKNFLFRNIDALSNTQEIECAIKRADVVLPLIAIATPATYVKNPLKVFELDFELNSQIVKLCAKYNKRLVFPSTSEVYGMCEDAEFDECKSNFVLGAIKNERWIYSNIKQLLDRLIWAYGKHEGLSFTIFRPFNFIGARLDSHEQAKQNSARVITQFVYNILNLRPLKLVNGGNQKRSFTYISDGIDCLMKILENRNGCANSQIFNIGNPTQICSIKELAEILISEVAKYPDFAHFAQNAKIELVSGADYYAEGYQDVECRVPSITRAKELLGWSPKIDLQTAIKHILNFHLLGKEDENCL